MSASQGPNYPTAAATDGLGVDWANPGNATADDGNGATCILALETASSRLSVTGFGFALPASARPDGFVVEIKKKDAVNLLLDNGVFIFLSGLQGLDLSTDQSEAARWPVSYATSTYGSSSDRWALVNLTGAHVNTAGFGAEIGAYDDTGAATGDVDFIRMTVYYHPRGPGTLATMGVGALIVALGLANLVAPMAAYFFAALAGLTLAWLGRVQKQTRTALAR